jgi:Putative transposase
MRRRQRTRVFDAAAHFGARCRAPGRQDRSASRVSSHCVLTWPLPPRRFRRRRFLLAYIGIRGQKATRRRRNNERIGRALERGGILARDAENSYLDLEAGGAMDDLLGHSITYRVAVGPQAGRKVFSLQTVAARAEAPRPGVAQYAGFSLHAGMGVEAEQRGKLERLARYVSRPPVPLERLDLTAQGQVRYRLKTPYRDRTTHIVLEPLDFVARLAALVRPPRVHLTRYHGVFAAHAIDRSQDIRM